MKAAWGALALLWVVITLWVLQVQGRISNQELAERIGLSASPCLWAIDRDARAVTVEHVQAALTEAG